jgi:FAD synthetase
MPPFMRCNPIIDWDYGKVWEFLRHTEWRTDVPYCSLYDMGYTSLGTVKDTLPCPALLKTKDDENVKGEGKQEYWPAYMLKDWSMERAGRIDKKQTNDVATEEEVHPIQPLSSRRRLTVGLIVIGDEILKGMTPDSNIVAAAKALRSNGVSLSRVSVVSDDPTDTVNEIQRFVNIDKDNNALVDIVITSGGVGPTHDDVTIKSVAQALNLGMEINHEMAELLLEKMGSNVVEEICDDTVGEDRREALVRRLSEGQRKMSMLPTSSILQYLGGKNNDDIQNNDTTSKEWPLLQCKNIFILPGVPLYFEKKIKQLAAYLPSLESTTASPIPRSETHLIILALPEDTIVMALNAAVAAHPQVSFGSYPIVRTSSDEAPKTIITLEGKVQQESSLLSKAEIDRNVEIAKEDLLSSLPNEGIVCVDAFDDLNT